MSLEYLFSYLSDLIGGKLFLISLIKTLLIFLLGLVVVNYFSRLLNKVMTKYHSSYSGMIASKIFYYVTMFLLFMIVLDRLGVNTTQILGAAGVLGIAIGFAAQTSVSNIISGLFLIMENPFTIGDRIEVGDITGKIIEIDLLSVRLLTLDNDYIRVPNEYLIKNSFKNLTRFENKRIAVQVTVSYEDDLKTVLSVIKKVMDENEYNKNHQESSTVVTAFNDSGILLTVFIWVNSIETTKAKSSLLYDIQQAFIKNNIKVPYPHIVVKN